MRPITLRVSGFTCFREDQPALDFSALDLFAITGPTGAGKSSVLDAITYALYGRVPRMGKQGVRELISHGRDRLTVMLAFAVGGQHYVVSRTTRRSGGTQCQLDALHGNASTPVASGVKPVGEAVTRILGLDYDAFTQAVLLPQGEFSRFLKGAAADRRRILQELLRLTLYGRMREIAGQRHATARARTAALTQQLEGPELATPAALALLEGERRELVASLETLRETVQARQAERAAVSARVQLHRERQTKTIELSALDAQATDQERRELRLERARAARVAAPLLDVLERDDVVLRGRERDRKIAASEARTTRAAETRARKVETEARAAAAEIPSLQARVDALRGLEGRVDHRAALERDLRRLDVESRDVGLLVADLARRSAVAETACAEAATRLTTAEDRRRQSTYDDAALSACEAHRDRAIELQRDREAVPALLRRVRAAVATRDEARQTHDAALSALEEASTAHDRAIVEREAAWRHQQMLWDRHRAMTLRAHLAPGHACPVCEQHVDAVPAVVPGPDQTEADDAANETAETVQLAAIRVRQASDAASRAAATLQGAEHDLARLSADSTSLQARVAASDDDLRRAVRAHMPVSAGAEADATPDAWILARLAVLREARTLAEVAAREWQIAREVSTGAQASRALAVQAHAAAVRDLERVHAQRLAVQEALAAVSAVIAAVTDAEDPRAELEGLVREIARLDGDVHTARDGVTKAAFAAIEAATHLRDVDRQVADARAARAASETAALTILASQGFEDAGGARRAWLAEAAYAALADERDAWLRTRARLLSRIDELDAEIGPTVATEADLAVAAAACASADEALGHALGRRGELDAQITTTRHRLDEAATVRARLTDARADLDVYGVLTADLQANAFQDWLLGEVFERLVQGASVRLMELSSRYTLQWIDQEFYVVDHDNAGERRTADTLSGGETFLASLALALELSEQVQRASGAVRLDSLFIDEGFGSLDADAQDVVASAIESLQVSGRMVGIITHVRELTDRMPASVVIHKRMDGSRWAVRSSGSSI